MAPADFASYNDLFDFIDALIQKLQAQGFESEADSLIRFRSASFTTSSELFGELGLILKKIRRLPNLSSDIVADVKSLRAEVRKIWPHFNYLRNL